MTTCVIEVNDIELRAAVDGEVVASSPGVACAVNGQVELGARALAQAQLHPRATENRFWRDLNTAPLQQFGKRVRHHADLAYLHLEHLRTLARAPSAAVFAVPGSLSHEQLSLLLGIAQACRLKPLALVDSAVAAGAAQLGAGRWTHVDLQQHQAVITGLDVGERVTRGTVEVLPGLGQVALRQACVQVVTAAFVTHCRFDPLHHAATEQLLHDHLPEWLALLADNAEIRVQLEYRGARFDTRVERAAIVRAVAPLLTKLRAALPAGAQPVASHRLAAQPAYAEVFGSVPRLRAAAVFDGVRALSPDAAGEALKLVTTLPADAAPTLLVAAAATSTGSATHLLDHHTAFALRQTPLYLLARGGCSRTPDPMALCSVGRAADGPELQALVEGRVMINGRPVAGRAPLAAGDLVTFTGASALFTAIAVQKDDDA
jgi:hypothetical protein